MNEDAQKLFTSCQDYLEIFCRTKSGEVKQVNIFHYPIKSWNERKHGGYVITGHEHGNLPYKDTECGLDVGWDVFHKPVSFTEVHDILSKRKDSGIGHHKKGVME